MIENTELVTSIKFNPWVFKKFHSNSKINHLIDSILYTVLSGYREYIFSPKSQNFP